MKYYIDLGKKLFPLNRSITGLGTLKTLQILNKENKLIKLKKIRCGTKSFDWKIPSEWIIREAYIKDKYGKKIVDIKNNNLHLVSYSQKIKKRITKIEILKKIHSLPKNVRAIPYKTSYYKKDWGFCVSEITKKKIETKYNENDLFFININSKFNKKGFMNYGEAYIPGESKDEILISTYICHPSMANNELSGPLLSLALINFFSKKKNMKSLRFVFVPETIGAISYISKNLKKLKNKVIGGFVLSCVGDNNGYSYIQTKYGNSISDIAVKKAFKSLKIRHKIYPFLKRGSDERQYNSSGVDIPIGTLMRSRFGTYNEYHTSLDNFKIVTSQGLTGSFKVAIESINNLLIYKKNKVKKRGILTKKNRIISTIKCEPFLEKRFLYPKYGLANIAGESSSELKSESYKKLLAKQILDFMQYSDGNNDLKNISKLIKLPLSKTKKVFNLLKKKKLIRVKD